MTPFPKVRNRAILFTGATHETRLAMAQAYSFGYKVFAVDRDPLAPGLVWARRHGVDGAVADAYDPVAVIREVCRNRWDGYLDGVISVGVDNGPVVSAVARSLTLPHIPEHLTRLGWDKPALKRKLTSAGIPVPPSVDLVIKPVDGRGARGVQVVAASSLATDSSHWSFAQVHSRTATALVEQYLPGPQLSAEAVVYEGQVAFCGLTDRYYDTSLTIESGGSGPVGWGGPAVTETVSRVVEALGVEAGTIKLDLVLNSNNNFTPTVIEAAIGRLSGGHSCTLYLPLSYGIHFVGAALAVACGDDPRSYLVPLRPRRFVCGRYEMSGQPTSHLERGRFFLGVGRTAKEALFKAEGWLERKRVSKIGKES